MSGRLVREHLQRQQEALQAELEREKRQEQVRRANENSLKRKRRRPMQSEETRKLAEEFSKDQSSKKLKSNKAQTKDLNLSKKQRRQLAQSTFAQEYESFVNEESRNYEHANERILKTGRKVSTKTNKQASKLLSRLAKSETPSHHSLTAKQRRVRKPYTLYGDGAREEL